MELGKVPSSTEKGKREKIGSGIQKVGRGSFDGEDIWKRHVRRNFKPQLSFKAVPAKRKKQARKG